MKIRVKGKGKRTRGNEVPPETMRYLRARHEASHGVVAHALGLVVYGMTLDEDEASRHRRDLAAVTTRECGTWRENALVSAAGRLCDDEQAARLGIRFEYETVAGREHNDDENFFYWLDKGTDLDPARATALIEPFFAEVEAILDSRRAAVTALAYALADHTLTEAEVLAILGPLPTVTPETRAEREATKAALAAPSAEAGA